MRLMLVGVLIGLILGAGVSGAFEYPPLGPSSWELIEKGNQERDRRELERLRQEESDRAILKKPC